MIVLMSEGLLLIKPERPDDEGGLVSEYVSRRKLIPSLVESVYFKYAKE